MIDELNEMAVVKNDAIPVDGEATVAKEADVMYVDACGVLAVGAVGGALAVIIAQEVWNCKLVKKVRRAVTKKAADIRGILKPSGGKRKRNKQNEVVDAEVIPPDDAANE